MHVCSFTNGYDMGGGQFMWGDYFVVVVVGLFTDVYTDVCTQIKKMWATAAPYWVVVSI